MKDHIIITLPHPPRVLSPNYRAVWQAKLEPKRRAREAAMIATMRALGSADGALDGLVPVGYKVRWYYWLGVAPDVDNVLASCKAYLDGVAQQLRVNDRTLECLGIERIKDRRADLDIFIHYERPEAELPLFDRKGEA